MEILTNYARGYARAETLLRQGMATGRFIPFDELRVDRELGEFVGGNERRLRDMLQYLKNQGKIESKIVPLVKRSKGGRLMGAGYCWKEGEESFVLVGPVYGKKGGEEEKAMIEKQLDVRKPGKVEVVKVAKPKLDEVEMCLNGIVVVIGMNSVTGRVKITIGGDE